MRLALIVLAATLAFASGYDLDNYKRVLTQLSRDPAYRADFKNHVEYLLGQEPDYFEYTPFKQTNFTFDCDVDSMTSPSVPSSVHELRPGDIKVVGAMGDSITAALGAAARTIPGLIFEFRGRSWSIGGQSKLERVVTMPNILKKFNPDLKGYSTLDDISFLFRKGVGFNAAVSGQESNHIPGRTHFITC
jgi:hypothetical protein